MHLPDRILLWTNDRSENNATDYSDSTQWKRSVFMFDLSIPWSLASSWIAKYNKTTAHSLQTIYISTIDRARWQSTGPKECKKLLKLPRFGTKHIYVTWWKDTKSTKHKWRISKECSLQAFQWLPSGPSTDKKTFRNDLLPKKTRVAYKKLQPGTNYTVQIRWPPAHLKLERSWGIRIFGLSHP